MFEKKKKEAVTEAGAENVNVASAESAAENEPEKSNSGKAKFKAIDVALIAMMTALIAVCSWITIPFGDVPFTMQTFAVFVAVGLLGWKRSTLSVIVYILIGVAGAPVFSGFRGGISSLVGPTGGYIVGFIFLALIGGLIIDKFPKKVYVMCIAMILGLAICYAFGTAWFMYVYIRNTGAITLAAVLGKCVVPYIIPDLLKMVLAVVISKAVKSRVPYLK